MSYAISIGLNIPDRASDQGPPDPIEPEFDLEGPDFYVTYDDGEKGGNVLFKAFQYNMGPGYFESKAKALLEGAVKQHSEVSIQYGWRWRLEGGEWMFAPTEEIAEENACEAYMERIEEDDDE